MTTAIAPGINLDALMKSLAQSGLQAQAPLLAAAAPAKTKKKAPTVAQKREKSIIAILDAKDTLGLKHTDLLLQLTKEELDATVIETKIKHGRQ